MLAVAFGGLLGCQERTQATLDISTDLPCEDITETAISVGEFATIERTLPITTTPGCMVPAELEIGTLAVVPTTTDHKSAKWATRIVAAVNAEVSTCQPPEYGPQCIVARRATKFIDGRSFTLPVPMRESCLGVLCPENLTCVDGVCRDPNVDPNECLEDDCDEGGLGSVEAVPWRRSIGGFGEDVPNDLEAIPGGDVIVVGSFAQEVDFGNGPLDGNGLQDGFIARLGPSGEYRWAKTFGGEGFDSAYGVHVSRVSVIIVTGTFRGTLDLGGESLTSEDASSGFIAALGGLGTPRWTMPLSGAAKDSATDSQGNVYVVASFTEALTIGGSGGTIVDGVGGTDAALIKIDRNGELVDVVRIGGAFADTINDVVVDSEDNIYVSGAFERAITIGEEELLSATDSYDVLIASFDSDLEARWAKSFGAGGSDIASGLAISDADEIAVTGALGGQAAYDGTLIGSEKSDGFVIRIDTDGNLIWHNTFGAADGTTGGERVAYDEDGRLLVSGYFMDGLSFHPAMDPMAGVGWRNAFIVTFDDDIIESTRSFVATHFATSRGIAPAGGGAIFVTGMFSREMNFDGEPLSAQHESNQPIPVEPGLDPAPDLPPPLHADIFLGRIPPR